MPDAFRSFSQVVAPWVYVLCMLTSLACAALLYRGYTRSRAHLLLWAAICFLGLTINNLLLFCDRIVFPDIDLLLLRQISTALSLGVLIYGLIWDAE